MRGWAEVQKRKFVRAENRSGEDSQIASAAERDWKGESLERPSQKDTEGTESAKISEG